MVTRNCTGAGDPFPTAVLRALGILLATLVLVPAAVANGDPLDVDLSAPDGFLLKATYYAADHPGPGVLLLHQCNRDRRSWDPLARALADAGLHVLTLDFRGFGESVGGGVRSFQEQGEELWPLFDGDVDRALEFLVSLPDVDSTRVGAAGASCGGSQVLLLATRFETVRALVFLSSSLPWIDDQEVVALHKNREIPLLGIAAVEDHRTAERTRWLFDGAGHPRSRFVLYKGNSHGVPLFEEDPSLVSTIVDFFAHNL